MKIKKHTHKCKPWNEQKLMKGKRMELSVREGKIYAWTDTNKRALIVENESEHENEQCWINAVSTKTKQKKTKFDLKKCLMIVMSLPLADKNLEINNEIADLSEKLNQAEVIIKKNNTEIGNLAASNKSEKEKNEQLKQANIWEEKYKEGIKYIESLEKENNKQIQGN
ncbi:hypothetical protein RFI_03615 [Reticulomyxa filosa]|uniref:Uncharacterized protein n=1 Tax=Reticulomyxa filosa TaxID=46433 RepID=X6P5L1_RETFI|nr:hypothetical protein RFI_03615 [Reticulomyxa filosa]|eukprot:ETO33491.1 hypothetical protein RFI_03615 [Reticulomyxa filosa]